MRCLTCALEVIAYSNIHYPDALSGWQRKSFQLSAGWYSVGMCANTHKFAVHESWGAAKSENFGKRYKFHLLILIRIFKIPSNISILKLFKYLIKNIQFSVSFHPCISTQNTMHGIPTHTHPQTSMFVLWKTCSYPFHNSSKHQLKYWNTQNPNTADKHLKDIPKLKVSKEMPTEKLF